jgi:predicted nucleic acid-binding protein
VERGIAVDLIAEQITTLASSAEWALVPDEKIEDLLSDPDDNVIVACAVEGDANYLITYDPHFDSLKGNYRGIKIIKAIPFLEILRRNKK